MNEKIIAVVGNGPFRPHNKTRFLQTRQADDPGCLLRALLRIGDPA